MHPWRPITLVGIAFATLSLTFPFATLPVVGSIGGLDADAWPALLPLIPVALAAAFGDWTAAPRPGRATLLVVLGCGAVLFAVVKAVDAIIATRDVVGATTGAGVVVLVGGTVVALAGTVVALSRSLR